MAAVLAVLAPMAPLVVSLCETMPCCAGGGNDRVSAPMECCQPAICAAPPPGDQPKAVDAPASPTVAALPTVTTEAIAAAPDTPDVQPSRTFTPLRVRLALIGTLLI